MQCRRTRSACVVRRLSSLEMPEASAAAGVGFVSGFGDCSLGEAVFFLRTWCSVDRNASGFGVVRQKPWWGNDVGLAIGLAQAEIEGHLRFRGAWLLWGRRS